MAHWRCGRVTPVRRPCRTANALLSPYERCVRRLVRGAPAPCTTHSRNNKTGFHTLEFTQTRLPARDDYLGTPGHRMSSNSTQRRGVMSINIFAICCEPVFGRPWVGHLCFGAWRMTRRYTTPDFSPGAPHLSVGILVPRGDSSRQARARFDQSQFRVEFMSSRRAGGRAWNGPRLGAERRHDVAPLCATAAFEFAAASWAGRGGPLRRTHGWAQPARRCKAWGVGVRANIFPWWQASGAFLGVAQGNIYRMSAMGSAHGRGVAPLECTFSPQRRGAKSS